MPRIRSLHPGQWSDDKFVALSDGARLLAIAVRNFADDAGIFEWNPLKLKMWCFPADSRDVVPLLAELEQHGVVLRYSIDDKEYGEIRNFGRFQRIRKPSFLYPARLNDGEYGTGAGPSTPQSANNGSAGPEPPPSKPPSVPHQYGKSDSEVGGRREGVGVLHQHRALPSDSQSRSDSARAAKTEPDGGDGSGLTGAKPSPPLETGQSPSVDSEPGGEIDRRIQAATEARTNAPNPWGHNQLSADQRAELLAIQKFIKKAASQ